MYGICGDL